MSQKRGTFCETLRRHCGRVRGRTKFSFWPKTPFDHTCHAPKGRGRRPTEKKVDFTPTKRVFRTLYFEKWAWREEPVLYGN